MTYYNILPSTLIGIGTTEIIIPEGWNIVGNPYTISGLNDGDLAAMSATRVAVVSEGNDDIQAFDFDGTDWAPVGTAFDLSFFGVNAPRVEALSSSRIVVWNDFEISFTTYDFNGTTWSKVGNSKSMPNPFRVDIAAMSATRIAWIDADTDSIIAFDFDGTNWTQTGNALDLETLSGVTALGETALTKLTSSRVAWADSSNDEIYNLNFDGTDWTKVGGDINVIGLSTPCLATLGTNQIVLYDDNGDNVQQYSHNGTSTFSFVGVETDLGTITDGRITGLNSNSFALLNPNTNELTTYEYYIPE